MKSPKFATYLFLLSSVFLIQCKTDKQASLEGRWEIKYGEFNGQPAPSLQGFYFQFDNKNVKTNFNESTIEEIVPFTYKNAKISKKSDPAIEFEVISLTDSTLEMTTEMRGADFKLVLNHISH